MLPKMLTVYTLHQAHLSSNFLATMEEVITATGATTGFDENVAYYMFGWLVPVAIGIPGNILAILITTRKHNRNLSPSIYMMAMGMADTVILLEIALSVVMNVHIFREGYPISGTWAMK